MYLFHFGTQIYTIQNVDLLALLGFCILEKKREVIILLYSLFVFNVSKIKPYVKVWTVRILLSDH